MQETQNTILSVLQLSSWELENLRQLHWFLLQVIDVLDLSSTYTILLIEFLCLFTLPFRSQYTDHCFLGFCSKGKMVCTGAKSEQDSRLAARKYAKIIMKLGFKDIRFQDFKIQNIVGSCDVKFPIRLEGLHYKHCLFSSYEPELFPGLIYRMKKPKVVLLIFVSGKVWNCPHPHAQIHEHCLRSLTSMLNACCIHDSQAIKFHLFALLVLVQSLVYLL